MISKLPLKYAADSAKEHRQIHGQFFTPETVAKFMCRWIMESNPEEILDPAFGLGAFFSAAQEINPTIPYFACEIDKKIIEYFLAHVPNDHSNLTIACQDYFSAWGRSAKAIVCNPPYRRFQHFANRTQVFRSYEKNLGIRLTGYTNTASAFLMKSLHELRPGGRLAYIMPFEFLNTGYGSAIKAELLKNGMLKQLIRIDAEKDVFPDAITTIVIVLVARDGVSDPVLFSTIDSVSKLESENAEPPGKLISRNDLDPKSKWLCYFEEKQISINKGMLVPLAYYGNFSRGIATGANEFFTLSKSDIARHRLPESVLSYCISKSAQVKKNIFTDEDLCLLRDSDTPIYVLNIRGKPEDAVANYIKLGEEKEFHKRYLTKCRNPWYKLEHRTPPPIWMGVFSRDGYKVIRNYSSAVNLTCFHGFYPNIFGTRYVDHLFLYFLSRTGQTILRANMRRYGDKLDKFEPNDLNDTLVPCPEFFDELDTALLAGIRGSVSVSDWRSRLNDLFGSLIVDSEEVYP